MNRCFVAVVACAALAGCVRENAELANPAPARMSSANDSAPPAPAGQDTDTAARPRTGSRLLPSPESLTDPVITAKVRASILADPALRGTDVSVNTTQGVVSLTGLVASQEQAARVSAHAQEQDGVVRVDSHLAVDLR